LLDLVKTDVSLSVPPKNVQAFPMNGQGTGNGTNRVVLPVSGPTTFLANKERQRIEFLVQFFNLTNRANFGHSYVGNVQRAAFGTPNAWYAGASNLVPKSFAAEMGVRYSF